jgi:hypothetical protein
VEKGRLRASLKKVCLKSWRIAQFEQKPVKDNVRAANGTLSLEGRHI